jgi:asparagine synthase (glutamine-hydrolysing)
MSGIMGIYYLDGHSVERQDLTRMVDTLAHRGPDGANIWCDRSIGFGHRMLWTTPESLLERLPLENQAGNLVIVSDARIDNRTELIHALKFDNYPLEKITDSQLILAAYEKWDECCPEYLLGDFAFVIWDKRKQTLFCARDHMGVKPFYYYYQANRIFAFGSEIKALLCLQEIPRQLNEVKVADYLGGIFFNNSSTFYQGIVRLPPASHMTVNLKGVQTKTYWTLDPNRELKLSSDEEYAEALREIFAEAVRCRLRSAFPIGSHLSGGLDSSSVTCMARQLLMQENGNRPLHTFSNIFETVTECDESSFAKAVIAQGNLIPHYVHADRLGPLSDLEHIFQYLDEAISAPTHFLAWGLNYAANQEGIRVVLDGFDGDNTVSHGDGYFSELANKRQWAIFAQEAEGLCNFTGGSPLDIWRHYGSRDLENLARKGEWVTFLKIAVQISKHFKISPQKLFLDYGCKPLLPQPMLQLWRTLHGHNKLHQSTNFINTNFINTNFAQSTGLNARIQRFQNSRSTPVLTERELHLRGLSSGLLTCALELSDPHASSLSLEVRHPFMDKRLLEFCLSLPPEQKLHKGWSRIVMRRAMKDILPEEVRWRRNKSNMSPSFCYGLLTLNRSVLNEIMQSHIQNAEVYVDTTALRTTYERLLSNNELQLEQDLIRVWRIAMLVMWLHYKQF